MVRIIPMSDNLSISGSTVERTSKGTARFGSLAEDVAVRYLSDNGLQLIMTNFTVPVGRNRRGVQRTGEIDIIASDGDVICFIEVKARRSIDFAPPTANIDLRKQRQVIRAARAYRRIFNIYDVPFRYDALTIVWPRESHPNITYLKDYWNESVFRKKRWQESHANDSF